MIVCICEAISDREINARIDAGDRSVRDLSRSCGAGSDCGTCGTHLRRLIDQKIACRAQELLVAAK